jgi:cob(I)alamin adenosyltransferase
MTGTGDKGRSCCGMYKDVRKDDTSFDLLGDLDELNSWIGLIRQNYTPYITIGDDLKKIQAWIFEVGMYVTDKASSITPAMIEFLEQKGLEMEKETPTLKNFILPSYPSEVHLARAVCRRVERKMVTFCGLVDATAPFIFPFLNRLSDYLFLLARYICHICGKEETIWQR